MIWGVCQKRQIEPRWSASRFVNIDRNSIAKKFPNPPDLSKKSFRASANFGACCVRVSCRSALRALQVRPGLLLGASRELRSSRGAPGALQCFPCVARTASPPRRRWKRALLLIRCFAGGARMPNRTRDGSSDGALDGTWRGSWAALPAAGSDSVDSSARRGQKPPLMAFSFSFLAHEWRASWELLPPSPQH